MERLRRRLAAAVIIVGLGLCALVQVLPRTSVTVTTNVPAVAAPAVSPAPVKPAPQAACQGFMDEPHWFYRDPGKESKGAIGPRATTARGLDEHGFRGCLDPSFVSTQLSFVDGTDPNEFRHWSTDQWLAQREALAVRTVSLERIYRPARWVYTVYETWVGGMPFVKATYKYEPASWYWIVTIQKLDHRGVVVLEERDDCGMQVTVLMITELPLKLRKYVQ